MTNEIQYRVMELSQLDVSAIGQTTGITDYAVQTPDPDPHRHNELATLAIIGGIAVVNAAAGYFFGKRKSETIDLVVEVVKPDGSTKRVVLKLTKSETEPVDLQILTQLKSVLGA